MNNVQEFADSASNYKKLTTKRLCKKRGRSWNRKEKRRFANESRIIRDNLAASFARREFNKEMGHFEKTVKEASGRGIFDIPMPEFLVNLRDNMNMAEGNLESARISQEAMNQFPPLTNV